MISFNRHLVPKALVALDDYVSQDQPKKSYPLDEDHSLEFSYEQPLNKYLTVPKTREHYTLSLNSYGHNDFLLDVKLSDDKQPYTGKDTLGGTFYTPSFSYGNPNKAKQQLLKCKPELKKLLGRMDYEKDWIKQFLDELKTTVQEAIDMEMPLIYIGSQMDKMDYFLPEYFPLNKFLEDVADIIKDSLTPNLPNH
jgi:hypothetical protein